MGSDFGSVAPTPSIGAGHLGVTAQALDQTILAVGKTWDTSNPASPQWLVNLSWSGGETPYTVSSSQDAAFQKAVTTLAKNVNSGPFTLTTPLNGPLDNPSRTRHYTVTPSGPVSLAVQGIGYDPEPAPTTPTASATTAWWGDTITESAQWLDPVAQGKANLMMMGDLPVRASAVGPLSGNYATSADFKIPDDARTFPSEVVAHGRPSPFNTGSTGYVTLSPPAPVGPFTNIHSVVWAPQTGKVWVAADGVVQANDIFLHTPVMLGAQITAYSKPYISRPTAPNASTPNVILVVNGVAGVLEVDQVTVDQNGIPQPPTRYAYTHDQAFTRNITPVGIAVDPDGTACYIADGSTRRVVKIPVGAGSASTIKDAWGGITFVYPLSDPCGIDVNVGHQVVVATNDVVQGYQGWTYQLTGPNSATYDQYVGTGIHGIEIDRDCSTTLGVIYVSTTNIARAEAFNLNQIGSNPAAYHGGAVYGLANGRLELDSDAIFFALHHYPQRVVINDSSSGSWPYPSVNQQSNRIMRLDFACWPGIPLQLRVIDPPDLSPYAPDGGWSSSPLAVPPYEGNDNTGTTDYGLASDPNASTWATTVKFVTGSDPTVAANWTLTAYLKVPARYSGDNFQVEVTKCDAGGNVLPQRVAGLTAAYTDQKRIFIERDKMFRNGGLLYSDYLAPPDKCGQTGHPACPCGGQGQLACNQIEVYNWSNPADNWQPPALGDTIIIFDETNTAERSGEQQIVTFVGPGSIPGSTLYLTLLDPLRNNYFASAHDNTPSPTFTDHSGGFGVLSGCDASANQINTGSCFFDPDMRDFQQPFGDAYIEPLGVRDGMGAIPFVPQSWFDAAGNVSGFPGGAYFSQIWFKNFVPAGGNPPQFNAPHNYLHLIGASAMANVGATVALPTGSYGFSYVFVGEIKSISDDNGYSNTQRLNYEQEVPEHEIAHEFNLNGCTNLVNCNPPPPTWGTHDYRHWWYYSLDQTYCPPNNPDPCLMDPQGGNPTGGINRFCIDDLLAGDPHLCAQYALQDTALRTHKDPI